MTFGEKLQLLRKQKGMSQEELASQVNISRQAVSKWELDSSTPDIGNIVQLSKIFAVSTDYLLHDEMESYENTSELGTKENDIKKEVQLKTAITTGLGIVVIGLIISFAGWKTYRTELSVAIGIIVQILGIIVFEIIQIRVSANNKSSTKIKFYTIACWLICPFPSLLISYSIMRSYPRPYPSEIRLAFAIIIYLVICTSISFILKKKIQVK